MSHSGRWKVELADGKDESVTFKPANMSPAAIPESDDEHDEQYEAPEHALPQESDKDEEEEERTVVSPEQKAANLTLMREQLAAADVDKCGTLSLKQFTEAMASLNFRSVITRAKEPHCSCPQISKNTCFDVC